MIRKKHRVRFNLARGKHYMQWKVEWKDGSSSYYHPTSYQLVLKGATLKNTPKVALRIFQGETKTVCAWVLCEEVEVRENEFIRFEGKRLLYNPKKTPFWTDDTGQNRDGSSYEQLHTIDFRLHVTPQIHKIWD